MVLTLRSLPDSLFELVLNSLIQTEVLKFLFLKLEALLLDLLPHYFYLL